LPFTNTEKINAAGKLTLSITGTADDSPGRKFWYNEDQAWSPIIDPVGIWTDFDSIPGAATPVIAAANAVANPTIMEDRTIRLTLDITSNNRAYLARTTFGDHSSEMLNNWIQPSLIRTGGSASAGYIIRFYHGDPSGAGVEITTAYLATAGDPTWSFSYSAGIIKISTDQSAAYRTFYDTNGLWIQGFRYIGTTGGGAGGIGSFPDVLIHGGSYINPVEKTMIHGGSYI